MRIIYGWHWLCHPNNPDYIAWTGIVISSYQKPFHYNCALSFVAGFISKRGVFFMQSLEHRHTWKFLSRGEIFNFNPGWKKLVSHLRFNPGQNEYFLLHFTLGWKYIAKICGIFYKNILRKTTFRMKLQDYIKTMMLDFINKRTQQAQRRCDNIVTTLWHGRKWELRRRRSPTLWQHRCPTLSRRCHSVATTLNNCFIGHFITDNSDFFPSKREKVTKVLEYWIQSLARETYPS